MPQMPADVYRAPGGQQPAVSTITQTKGDYAVSLMERHAVASERTARITFDKTHPVDEYISSPGVPQPNANFAGYQYAVQLQPTYEMPECIESIIVTVPAGAQSAIMKLADRWIPVYTTPFVATPAVPASTVAQENDAPYPVLVIVSGGTVTAVTVNGQQVGTGDGSYEVPAGQAIAITYTVAPTWAWFYIPLQSPQTFSFLGLGLILNQDDDRFLLMTGSITAGPTHFELMGHADEIYGNA
jgi:hypothetical protein